MCPPPVGCVCLKDGIQTVLQYDPNCTLPGHCGPGPLWPDPAPTPPNPKCICVYSESGALIVDPECPRAWSHTH